MPKSDSDTIIDYMDSGVQKALSPRATGPDAAPEVGIRPATPYASSIVSMPDVAAVTSLVSAVNSD